MDNWLIVNSAPAIGGEVGTGEVGAFLTTAIGGGVVLGGVVLGGAFLVLGLVLGELGVLLGLVDLAAAIGLTVVITDRLSIAVNLASKSVNRSSTASTLATS